jgi:hypothetical protein
VFTIYQPNNGIINDILLIMNIIFDIYINVNRLIFYYYIFTLKYMPKENLLPKAE